LVRVAVTVLLELQAALVITSLPVVEVVLDSALRVVAVRTVAPVVAETPVVLLEQAALEYQD
jgi:hypothetical protein